MNNQVINEEEFSITDENLQSIYKEEQPIRSNNKKEKKKRTAKIKEFEMKK